MIADVLVAAIVVCNMIDYFTTRKILANGGTELNPVMNTLFNVVGESFGLILAKFGAAMAVVALLYFGLLETQNMQILLVALAVFYAWVAWHNIQQLKK